MIIRKEEVKANGSQVFGGRSQSFTSNTQSAETVEAGLSTESKLIQKEDAQSATKTGGSLFGQSIIKSASKEETPQTGGLFGGLLARQTPNESVKESLFGNPSTSQPLFGSQEAKPTSLFGGAVSNTST